MAGAAPNVNRLAAALLPELVLSVEVVAGLMGVKLNPPAAVVLFAFEKRSGVGLLAAASGFELPPKLNEAELPKAEVDD